MIESQVKNEIIHKFFKATIFIKGFFGLLDIVIGALFLFFAREIVHKFLVASISQFSGYKTSNYLLRQTGNFTINTQYFIAIYFIFYGLVNLFLVASLLKGKIWAYPAAILFYIIFILYQFYRSSVHHSSLLLVLSIVDIFLIIPIWLEYRRVSQLLQPTKID
jgi:uncharacterized membrane protein